MKVNSNINKPLNRMLTVDEVAYVLHVHPTTVRKWEKLGQLKSYRLGTKGNVRFKTEDVSHFTGSVSRTPVMPPPSPPETGTHLPSIVRSVKRKNNNGEKEILDVAVASGDISKQIQQALKESEEKLSSIFSHIPMALSITRLRDNAIIEINDSYTILTGYTREDIIGRKVTELNIWVNLEDRERMLKLLKEQGRITNEEFNFRVKSGEVHPVLLSAEHIVIRGEDCLLVMSVDITKRKQLLESLRESEEKFSKAFSAASDAMCILSSKGGLFIAVNDNYVKFCGYSREELIGHNPDELKMWPNPEDRGRSLMLLKENGRLDHEEFAFRTKSGQIRTCLFSAEPIITGGEQHNIVVIQDITERKKTEQSLRESEEKFRNLFEHAIDAVILADADTGILVDINPAGCDMLGRPKGQIIGQHMTLLHPLEMAEDFKQVFREHVEKGLILADDSIIQRADGARIPASVSASVVKLGDRNIIQGVFRDMSGRKRAEEALRDSEEKFSRAFNVSGNAICITSLPDNEFLEINESYTRFTGYSREEVIGRTAAELDLWVDDEELKQLQIKLKEEGKFHNMEFHSRMKSGEIRVGLGSAEIINIKGKSCRIVVITDITERKKAEEALKDSEEKFSKAFSAAGSAICITSLKDNRFLEANESFSRFTGYPRNEIIGRSAADLNLWVKQEELKQWMDTLKKDGRVYNQEFSSRMKSGEIRIGLSSAEVINIGGEPCRIVVITDITERKSMEQELLDYRSHLEELVQKRTVELSSLNEQLEAELEERKRIERELIQAKNAAEGANRAKSDFLAHMSHEIRTPIHGVIGTLNLMLDGELKEEQRQYGNMAIASAESLLGIINDILDFSKIEAGQLVLEEMDFDLQTIVEEALQPMALSAQKKRIELICHIPPQVPRKLVGDGGRLRQTLVNLLGNGVKFTQSGEVSAGITIENESDNHVELHFTIRDTGIGIPEDKQKLLFNAFVQGNGSKYGGTGLGLAICRQLVSMMQGHIWLESQPGQGSAFHFVVGFKKSSSGLSTDIIPPEIIKFQGTQVLIVDDNTTNRLMLTELLESWGLAVTTADNEATALQQLKKIKDTSNSLPLILLDMILPDSNGLDIVKKMGDDPQIKQKIIIMLPCDNISDNFNRCQEAGIVTNLIKPVKKREIQNAILSALGAVGEKKKESLKRAVSSVPELKLRILVAEDNPTSQLIARKTLEKMGCTAQIAGNGLEATHMAEQSYFDLILMDFDMPEMNGIEATQVIREKERETNKHLPIIAMTAYAMKQDRDKCLEAGMDGYLTKPINPDGLYNALKGIATLHKPDQAPVTASQPAASDEPAAPMEPAVDLEAALRTVGGDKDILKEVLQVFLEEDSPRLLKSITEAIERQDGKAIKAEAHGMKGAAAAMGGKTIAAAAARLEAAGLSDDMAAARSIFDEMCHELERFKDFYSRTDLGAEGGDR